MTKRCNYLRLSVTEKCNLSCQFCHNEGQEHSAYSRMSSEEILAFCGIAKNCGFNKIKLTGGEPLIRKDLGSIISGLRLQGYNNLSIITNGALLEVRIPELKDSGLPRISVSLHTLDKDKYQSKTGRSGENVPKTLNGIDAAIKNGYKDIKLNFVYTGAEDDKDFDDVCDFARSRNSTVVLLPGLNFENGKSVSIAPLVKKMINAGIKSKVTKTDEHGLIRRTITLNNGTKILIRVNVLADIKPFDECSGCKIKEKCEECIYAIRLSAAGELIPCLLKEKKPINILHYLKKGNPDEIYKILLNNYGEN